jgi:cysteine desulfurase
MMLPEEQPIYLDYAATTPVDEVVIANMLPYMGKTGFFANSGSNHSLGKKVAQELEFARRQILDAVNGHDYQIIWTSGATEANNLAIKGLLNTTTKNKFNSIITCKTEHKSVIEPIRFLEQQGYQVTYLTPEMDGLINLDELALAIQREPALISIMLVNNETGVIQNIETISRLAKKYNSTLHCDCSQAFGKLNIDLQKLPIDMVSFSGHKIYAPKGVGALIVKEGLLSSMVGQIQGGDQEGGLRAGTLASHQIIGLSTACELIVKHKDAEQKKIGELSQLFLREIKKIPGTLIHGHSEQKLVNIHNLSFDCVNSRLLQKIISNRLAISLGSACNSESLEPSYVLRAMGLPFDITTSAVRISLGRYTTQEDILTALQILSDAVNTLRQDSKTWDLKTLSTC